MKYEMTFDLHTHTTFSHGKGSIEDNVKAAIEKGLSGIAISDHGRDHLFFGIRKDSLKEMRIEVERLKEIYPQIRIYLSVEANIYDIGTGTDIKILEDKYCDFAIAGYHFGVNDGYCISNWLYNKGIFRTAKKTEKYKARNTKMIINALEKNNIKILTHPGDKAIVDIVEIAKVCEEKEILMEISSHHDHLSVEELKLLADMNVKFIISSDAHKPEDVGTFEPGLKRAIESGIDISRIVNIVKIESEEESLIDENLQNDTENEIIENDENVNAENEAIENDEKADEVSEKFEEDIDGELESNKVYVYENPPEIYDAEDKKEITIEDIKYESTCVEKANKPKETNIDTVWDIEKPKDLSKEREVDIKWDVEKNKEILQNKDITKDSIIWERTEFPIRNYKEQPIKKMEKEVYEINEQQLIGDSRVESDKSKLEENKIDKAENKQEKKSKKKQSNKVGTENKRSKKNGTPFKGEQTMMDLQAIKVVKEPEENK